MINPPILANYNSIYRLIIEDRTWQLQTRFTGTSIEVSIKNVFFLVKVNKINYIKTHLIGKLVYRSGWKKMMFKMLMIFFSTLESRAGHNIDLRLIRFGVQKENLIQKMCSAF